MNINTVELGRRIRSARERAQMTQKQVAEDIDVSRPTLIAMEQGRRAPKRTEIERMMELYDISAGELYRQTGDSIDIQSDLRAMISGADTGNEVEHAVALLTRYVENVRYLEQIMGISASSSLPQERPIPAHGDVARFSQSVASSERARLGLGDQPIIELRQLLDQEAGVRIFYGPLSEKLAGLFAYMSQAGYYILVNRKHSPSRRRWTIAHEYGHFLSERHTLGVDYVVSPMHDSRSERFADAFAAEFLMPRSGIERGFYQTIRTSSDFHVADLCRLANRYFVSVQAMTLRLEHLNLLPHGTWHLLAANDFRADKIGQELGISTASARVSDHTLPQSYEFLAIRTFNENKLSIGQLAKLFDTDIVGARELIAARSQMPDDTDPARRLRMDLHQSLLDDRELAAG